MNVYLYQNNTEKILQNIYIGEYGWKPWSNTLAYYPLNWDLNDYSGNWRNLSWTWSFVSWWPWQVFNVTNVYSDDSAFDIYWTQAFTLCLRLKVTSMPSLYDSIMWTQQWSNPDTHDKEIDIWSWWVVNFQMWNGSEYLIQSNTNISANQWYNIVATFDGSSRKLYINWVNVWSWSGWSSYNNNPPRLVFRRRWDGSYNISNAVVENIWWSTSDVWNFFTLTKWNYWL